MTVTKTWCQGDIRSLGMRVSYARPAAGNVSKAKIGGGGHDATSDAGGTTFLLEVEQAACMKSQISMGPGAEG